MFDKLFSFGKNRIFRVALALTTITGLVVSQLQPGSIVQAAPVLTIESITWDVIGLDSNRPATGPRYFPVGARVCNAGTTLTADPLSVTFAWTSPNDYINIRPGTNSVLTFPALAAGDCVDAYFEVEVNGVSAAYRTTRGYTITATDGTVSATTPSPRQLYVEYLISQNRNATTDILFGTDSGNLTSVAPGGSMNLLVGGTYFIRLDAKTATQGYEQLETFITLSNTVFQILSVATTYSANTSPHVSSPNDKLYADACLWENDPNSPNYLACLDSGKKSGGTISVLYQVRILSGGGTTQTLNSLIYDFSGASYHYNSDYSVGARFANIIDPSTSAGFAKRFIPSTIADDGVATLRFTITNPHPVTVSGYNFEDVLPGAVVVADPANMENGCGGAVTAVPGSGSISLAGGVLAPNTSCNILVDVTAPYDAGTTYPLENVVDLYVGDAPAPAGTATAPLTVTATQPPPLVCGPNTLANWTFPSSNNNPQAPNPSVSNVTASASAGAGLIASGGLGFSSPYWISNTNPAVTTEALAISNGMYFEFVLDTTNVNSLGLTFTTSRHQNGPQQLSIFYGTSGSLQKAAQYTITTADQTFTVNLTEHLNSSGNTLVRFYLFAANGSANAHVARIANVQFSGEICTPNPGTPPNPPTLDKAFAPTPVRVGEVSTLTFTLTNPNAVALSGVTFRDELPFGMSVVAGTFVNNSCGGTWGLDGTDPDELLFTGGTLAANTSCTLTVNVISTSVGANVNISDPIDATETYPGNSASATLTVLPPPTPPVISKQFDPNPLLNPAGSTTLTFRITNTDPTLAISGVSFTDSLPAGMQVAAAPNQTNTCGGTWNPGSGDLALTFSGGSIPAGQECTLSVDVVVPGVDISGGAASFFNQTSTVSHVFNGITYQGNNAEATLIVDSPVPSLSFQKKVGLGADLNNEWFSFLPVSATGQVYYLFVVENTGEAPLNNVVINDPGVNTGSCVIPNPLPVASDEPDNEDHVAYCIVGPVNVAAGTHPNWLVQNTATASGTFDGTTYESEEDSATYAVAELTLVKTAAPMTFENEGEVITYTFTVTNTGSAILSGPITIDDSLPGIEITCPALTTIGNNDSVFDPGEEFECEGTYTITEDDVNAGSVTNTATASSSAPIVTSNEDSVKVDGPEVAVPAKSISKQVSAAVGGPWSDSITVAVGETVYYQITVDNTGNTALTGVTVSDPACTLSDPSGDTNNDSILDTDETWVYTCSVIAVAGTQTNTASANSNETDEETDDAEYFGNAPAMTILKTANPTSVSAAEQVITYTIIVTNTGNVDLTAVSVSDPMLSNFYCGDPLLPLSQPFSLTVGQSVACYGTYEVTQTDIDTNGGGDGLIENTATASDANEDITVSDGEDVAIQSEPLIGTAKRVAGLQEVSTGTYDVTYEILVRNYGSVLLTNIQITDDLGAAFPLPTTFSVQSISSDDFAVNAAYNGVTDTNMLLGTDNLAVNQSGIVTLVVRVIPSQTGPFENSATASGQPPSGDPVEDASQDGTDPDPDGDGDPTNNDEPTSLDFGPAIFDPPIGIKVFDDSGLPLLEWTMVWINSTNILAVDARVSDPIPVGTTYSATGLPSGFDVPPGAPEGSTNVGVRCYADPTSLTTTTTLCYYEGPTPTYPRGRILWEGSIGPDLGATNADNANNELYITFRINVPQETSAVYNVATIDVDLNGDGVYDQTSEVEVSSSQGIWTRPAAPRVQPQQLPATGFAPGVLSALPSQPQNLTYQSYASNNLVVEVPRLGVHQEIVGVPFANGGWDVTWLNQSIGYLNGTAFPGWTGNTALTGHVYGSDGLPGPFVNLAQLKWGDKVILYANGQQYTYEVRVKEVVSPFDVTPLAAKDRSWLTLITCQEYDPRTDSYRQRTVVQAVLMKVESLAGPIHDPRQGLAER